MTLSNKIRDTPTYQPSRTARSGTPPNAPPPTPENDFWQSGAVQPDVVLADLTYIFHPNLMPGYTP